jgi:hypothetical protein
MDARRSLPVRQRRDQVLARCEPINPGLPTPKKAFALSEEQRYAVIAVGRWDARPRSVTE